MDLNYVLIWMVLMSCVAALVIQLKRRQWGWVTLFAGLLVLTLLLLVLAQPVAGLVAGACWALFIVLPLLGNKHLARLVVRQDYAKALRVAMVIRVLHPLDGWWGLPVLLTSLNYAKQGDFARAEELLQRCKDFPSQFGQDARIHLFRLRGAWDECVQWAQSPAGAQVLKRNVTLQILYCRALGETGDLHRLLTYINERQASLQPDGAAIYHQILLYTFTFCGHTQGVDQILASQTFAHLPKSVQEFWRASAAMAAGSATAAARLAALPTPEDGSLLRAVEQRLSRPLVIAADLLGEEEQQALEKRYRDVLGEVRYQATAARTPPVGTYTLIALCLAMFIVELAYHGSTDARVLYFLGAQQRYGILIQGEWWRILTANFLHFGWVHLAMNMGALLIWGRILEPRLGTWRYLVTYLIAGMGAMWVVTLSTTRLNVISVGASGAIMGLLGAVLGTALYGWLRNHVTLARKQALVILALVVLQTSFDFLTPMVSMTAHLSGTVIGFLLSLILLRFQPMAGVRTAHG
ncbi:MAG TPA: rhomboid family intramembrane serine protease [Armatimonadota bacterium]|jgi:rhomboid protease GluP